MAQVETAWRWSNGLGFTSSLFIKHPDDLAATLEYQKMTWWAPGAPAVMGLLLRAGLSLEWAYKIYMLSTIIIGWMGWLLLAKRYLADYLCRFFWAGVLFCVLPLQMTPLRDPDEMAGWAVLPWLGLAVASLYSNRWLLVAFILGILSAVSLFFWYHSLHYLAVVVFVTAMLQIDWRKRIVSIIFVASPAGLVWVLLQLWSGSGISYLQNSQAGFIEQVRLFLEAVASTGIAPLIGLIYRFLPSQLVIIIDSWSDNQWWLGWIWMIIWLVIIFFFLKWYLRRTKEEAKLAANKLFFISVVITLPLFLIGASISVMNYHVYSEQLMYYYSLYPTWIFAGLLFASNFQKQRCMINIGVIVLANFFVILSVIAMFPQPSVFRANLLGYSYEGDHLARQRISFIQPNYRDMLLEDLRDCARGIVFTQHPQHYALIYQDSAHSFRPPPFREYWKRCYTSAPVTVYFIFPEGTAPLPSKHFMFTVRDRTEHEPMTELTKLPGWQRLDGKVWELGSPQVIYRADIPAGWRGEELFKQ